MRAAWSVRTRASHPSSYLTGPWRARLRRFARRIMSETRLWFESALTPDGWAARVRCTIENGRIVRLERDVHAGNDDERHAIGVPGLPNAHSHTFQRAIAGLAERRSPG